MNNTRFVTTHAARRLTMLAATALLVACGDSTGPLIGGIDTNRLFRPASSAEIAAVTAEWSARQPRAQSVVEEATSLTLMAGGIGNVRVFSHVVDGHRHYGATMAPVGAAAGSLPVVVYTHGGDEGVNVTDFAFITAVLGESARNFVYVIPSFRSERLTVGSASWLSEGAASPWDRDVDDALALLDVALQRVPEADASRIGVLGVSRGGAVGLLMAIREPRIKAVLTIAGPTDFMGPWVRGLTEDALRGQMRPLPGLRVLDERYIQPLRRGEISEDAFRRELIRRSPVLWASQLPRLQVHHGTADDVVPVDQLEALRSAVQRVSGRTGDEFFLYQGANHSNLLERPELTQRIIAFLQRLRQG